MWLFGAGGSSGVGLRQGEARCTLGALGILSLEDEGPLAGPVLGRALPAQNQSPRRSLHAARDPRCQRCFCPRAGAESSYPPGLQLDRKVKLVAPWYWVGSCHPHLTGPAKHLGPEYICTHGTASSI